MMTTKMMTTMTPTQQPQQWQQQWQYNNGRAMDAMMATTMQLKPFPPSLVWNNDYLSNNACREQPLNSLVKRHP
jgi:hypothetical protein